MLKGSVVLQVAALTHQNDAVAIADMLQQKRFPSFVVAPTTDNFYRVQVGPYPDQRAAEVAKAALDHAGFQGIIKH
jgi:DedD protein